MRTIKTHTISLFDVAMNKFVMLLAILLLPIKLNNHNNNNVFNPRDLYYLGHNNNSMWPIKMSPIQIHVIIAEELKCDAQCTQ